MLCCSSLVFSKSVFKVSSDFYTYQPFAWFWYCIYKLNCVICVFCSWKLWATQRGCVSKRILPVKRTKNLQQISSCPKITTMTKVDLITVSVLCDLFMLPAEIQALRERHYTWHGQGKRVNSSALSCTWLSYAVCTTQGRKGVKNNKIRQTCPL